MDARREQNGFLWVPQCRESWDAALHLGTRHVFEKNDTIIPSGQHVDQLYYIQEGQVRLSRVTPNGDEKIIWYVDAGTVFGETPFFDGLPAHSMHTSVGRSVIYTFSRQCIYGKIATNHPQIWENLLATLASKVRTLSNQICELSLTDLKSQVCKFLFHAKHKGFETCCQRGLVIIHARTSQQELASILGVHRVSVSKVLKQLKEEGVVTKYCKKEVWVADWDMLLEYATL